MKRKPIKKSERLINWELGKIGLMISFAMLILISALFLIDLSSFGFDSARTLLFTSAVLFEFAIIISMRRSRLFGASKEWLKNKFLLLSVIGSSIVQLLLLQFAITQRYFDLVPLSNYEYALIFAGIAVMYIVSAAILRFAGKEKK